MVSVCATLDSINIIVQTDPIGLDSMPAKAASLNGSIELSQEPMGFFSFLA